jgi:hypothetical protein
MNKSSAGMTQCFTCEYWAGRREYEAPSQISFDGPFATATCENSASTTYRNQVQSISVCNHWVKWKKI